MTKGEKISLAKKGRPNGRLGYRHTEETKKKIAQSEKGKKVSIETLEKLREVAKGRKQSEETKKKKRESLRKHWDKVGRKSKRPHRHIQDSAYRQWRLAVFTRDNWTCQICHKIGVYLEAHHIKSYAKFPDLRANLDNGVTLCRECHKLTDNYKSKAKNY